MEDGCHVEQWFDARSTSGGGACGASGGGDVGTGECAVIWCGCGCGGSDVVQEGYVTGGWSRWFTDGFFRCCVHG